jgi:glycosyltransferase involved in cell wall biosynthesis
LAKLDFGGVGGADMQNNKLKKVAVITAGILPMPEVKGGAIETLLGYVLRDNEKAAKAEYDVYSTYDAEAERASRGFKHADFRYIKVNGLLHFAVFNAFRVLRKIGVVKNPNYRLVYMRGLLGELKKWQYDLVIVESEEHLARSILRSGQNNVVLYLHNDKLNNELAGSEFLAENCKEIWCVSGYIKERVLTLGKKYAGKTKVIMNGVDSDYYNRKDEARVRKDMRKKLGIGVEEYVFMFGGRFEREKGVLELVEAFNMLGEPAKLLIVGGSFYSSNKKTGYVKEVERAIGGNKDIIQVGYAAHADVKKYLAAADCLVSPSQWQDPALMTNMEGMFSGIKIISSQAGGIPEYVGADKVPLVKLGENYVDDLAKAMRAARADQKRVKYKKSWPETVYVKEHLKRLRGVLK